MRQRGPDDELEVVYELRSDTALVSSMKALSRDPERPNLGLAPHPYLIGSRRFWRHLGTDRLPTIAVEGKITRVFWTGMGDHSSFEITAADGSVHEFTRHGDPSRYTWGLRTRVESVDMPWKPGVDQVLSPVSRIVTRVLVEPSPARSDSRAPGPFGVMLLQEHETSRIAWGLRSFEHWMQIEGISHPAIDDLIEHVWSWPSITEETFNDWYDHPPDLVNAPATPLGLELDADTAKALTDAIADATSLAYDNLFAGFNHDRHIVFASSLGHLLLPHGVNLPNPEVFRLPRRTRTRSRVGSDPSGHRSRMETPPNSVAAVFDRRDRH